MNWTKQNIEYLKNKFPLTSDLKLSNKLGKSPNAIRIKASRLDLRKESSTHRDNLQLDNVQEQVLLGGLLGDSYCRIKKPKSINANLEWAHGTNQTDYSYWKMTLLNGLRFNVRKTKDNILYFSSKNYKCLNYYHHLFYPNGKKTVNEQILNKINKLGLLIWYLDDGSYHKRDKDVNLHTNCFTLEEQKLIQHWFEKRWGIYPKIYKAKDPKNYPGKIWYYIHFSVYEAVKLQNLFINLAIPECMKYKIPSNQNQTYQNPTPGA